MALPDLMPNLPLCMRHWAISMSASYVDGIIINMSTLCKHLKSLGCFKQTLRQVGFSVTSGPANPVQDASWI